MISPKRPSGFNELLPSDQLAFNAMISVIRLNYEQYGYAPIETPALELAQVLLAKEGGETAKQVYRFTKGDTDLAMRFDLTIPLARYAAEHFNELAFPFRRYQIQEVWRAEKAQAGRYRQFYQCDIDILGSKSMMADADVILAARSAIHALGVEDAVFNISHRGLLQGLLESKKLSSFSTSVLRAVDKLDKQSSKAVQTEIEKLGINKQDSADIIAFTNIKGSALEVIKSLSSLNIKSEKFTQAINELQELYTLFIAAGMKPREISFNMSMARGFDYYTGVIFESFLSNSSVTRSIASGGRYDNLLGEYRRESLPGVGASIGVSLLFAAIKERLAQGPANPAHALIVPFEPETAIYCQEVALTLRRSGLNVLVYPGFERTGKQLSYADKLGIPFAILCGSTEVSKNKVTIKNLKTGKQVTVSLKKAAATIRKAL